MSRALRAHCRGRERQEKPSDLASNENSIPRLEEPP
jgi:hypothetical protein